MSEETILLSDSLKLPRCPHCRIAWPLLKLLHQQEVADCFQSKKRWHFYGCSNCAGVVCAWGNRDHRGAREIFPSIESVDDSIPEAPRRSLQQCRETFYAPDGSIMLAAKAVDEMLKAKNLKEGSLYSRITEAVSTNLITPEMEIWAHNIRLDANDQRHADEEAQIPTPEDAERSYKFAKALAEYLFVLPAMVTQGVRDSGGKTNRVKAAEDDPESPE